MVKLYVTLAATLLAGAAHAQPADWSQAGGQLVVAPTSLTTSFAAGAPSPSLSAPPAPPLSPTAAQPFDDLVRQAADGVGLDAKLIHALVVVESGYRPDALSTTRWGEHAAGLTQLMPATARALGVEDRLDPRENLFGGARYLADQLARFRDLRLALAAFNAGPGRVARLGRVPKIPETESYVVRVIDCYLALAAGRTVRSSADCRPAGGER